MSVSPRAYVAPWVTLGEGCEVHPFAVVGQVPVQSAALARQPEQIRSLSIGPRTQILPHATIYAGSVIGADCLIGDGASIREGAIIGDRCIIGRQVTVLYDVTLADDVRLQDMCHITGGCKIGEGCFFGPAVTTCNNRKVDLHNYHHPGDQPVTFGKRILVGAGATILAGVHVGDDALIGIGAVVVDNVHPGQMILGHKAGARVSPYANP